MGPLALSLRNALVIFVPYFHYFNVLCQSFIIQIQFLCYFSLPAFLQWRWRTVTPEATAQEQQLSLSLQLVYRIPPVPLPAGSQRAACWFSTAVAVGFNPSVLTLTKSKGHSPFAPTSTADLRRGECV